MNQIKRYDNIVTPSRSEKAVGRNGKQKFRKDFVVKGLRPPKAALRALDNKILSKHTPAIAIDGALRSSFLCLIALRGNQMNMRCPHSP